MPTITVGTNSYVTQVEADTYLDSSINGAEWATQTVDNRCRLLITAFRILEVQRWEGERTVETQPAQFPRTNLICNGETVDSATVPQRVKDAQIELANAILVNNDLATSPTGTTTAGIKRAEAGSAAVEFFRNNPNERILGSQRFPPIVQQLIGCFLAGTPVTAAALATGTDGQSQYDADRFNLNRYGYY